MTFAQFTEIFALLAVQLRCTDADEATIRAYFQALQDIEPELVALAAQRLGRTALNSQGEAWFPKAPEWRAMARTIEAERSDALRAVLRKRPTPLCSACDDTGWEPVQDSKDQAVRPCACQKTRRLEVLGRRPWPQLVEPFEADPGQEDRVMEAVSKLVKRHGA